MTNAGTTDPLARLLALREREPRRVVGLLSGTSADGIDAALVEIFGAGKTARVALVAFETTPFSAPLRARLHAAQVAAADELCELGFLLGHAFADAALAVAARAGVDARALDLIGSHGQTICHQPRSAGRTGATLQIGEAAVIAERLGAPVVSDFRARDVAGGGEGAPLVPLTDWILFREPGRRRLLLNLGGIANVTLVTADPDTVLAFDTGPANMPLDLVARVASGGAESCDLDGRRAARGRIDHALVAELLAAPFFALPPPRSTGREAFGAEWVLPLINRFPDRLDDLLATLTHFVAASVADACARFTYPAGAVDELLVSGGGVHNATLMAQLAAQFAPLPVATTAAAGIAPDAKEAIAFALLANETLFGNPGNLPATTGCAGPRVLGKITLP